MSIITFSRKDLYDLVWSEPMISLSKKYKISDNGLRRICKRMNIPLPKAGHWMKLQFGKKVRIMALPDSFPSLSLIVPGRLIQQTGWIGHVRKLIGMIP